MAKLTEAAKVGAFVAVTAVGAYLIFRTVSHDFAGGGGYTVHGYFDDATGLAPHSRVTMAGIGVGSINSIRLENGRARIDVKVNSDIPLFKNATAGKKSASLLGEYILVITPGTDDPKLKDGDEIKVVAEEGSLDEIKKDVSEVAKLVKEVAKQLAASIGTDKGGENIRLILQNLADATDALNQTVRENREVIKETLARVDRITQQGEPQLAKIMENVRAITEDVKVLVAAINGKGTGTGAEVKDTITHLDESSKTLQSALAHIDHVAERIDNGEGTIGKLTKDDQLIKDVGATVEGINDFIGPISRLQTIVALRSEYYFLQNGLKSYIELRLQPREDKYYVIELINDPRGKTTYEQIDVETTNPNDPARYRTLKTTTTNDFRFSLQFAKQLGFLRGRFGIKESTGGVGVDMIFFNDRLEIINDLFGFGEGVRPRYRVFLSYQFINHLWLSGGIDQVFTSELRDYFVGLQLRFNDEDLKSILPFAGASSVR